jgi:hypothetical protein
MTSDFGLDAKPSGGGFFPPSLSVVPTVPAVTSALAAQAGLNLAQRVSAVPGLSRSELRVADAAAISATLLSLWAAMKNRPVEELASGEMHQDGTLRLSSQVAVWLIGRVSEAYGRRTLVRLSGVKDVEVLRSLRGLAGLLGAVINADKEGTLV